MKRIRAYNINTTARRVEILSVLQDKSMTADLVAKKINVHPETARRNLRWLSNQGVIKENYYRGVYRYRLISKDLFSRKEYKELPDYLPFSTEEDDYGTFNNNFTWEDVQKEADSINFEPNTYSYKDLIKYENSTI